MGNEDFQNPFLFLWQKKKRFLNAKEKEAIVVAKSASLYFRLAAKIRCAPLLLLSPADPLRWAPPGAPYNYRGALANGTAAVMLYAALGDHSRPRPSAGRTGRRVWSYPPAAWLADPARRGPVPVWMGQSRRAVYR